MKKISLTLILAVLISACSLEQIFLIPLPTGTPVPTSTITYTPVSTTTPVTPTLTFTMTPTLSGVNPPTVTPEDTVTPVISVTPLALITPLTATPTVQMEGFLSVLVSPTEFYKGTNCMPSSVRFTVQVIDAVNVEYVLLFARFKSLRAERASKWTTIPMQGVGTGTYVHDLRSDEMLEDAYFQTSWVEYQLVAATTTGKEVGRTGIFKEKVTMLACAPMPTQTPATVRP